MSCKSRYAKRISFFVVPRAKNSSDYAWNYVAFKEMLTRKRCTESKASVFIANDLKFDSKYSDMVGLDKFIPVMLQRNPKLYGFFFSTLSGYKRDPVHRTTILFINVLHCM